jgi:tRNA(adenine34) deaminase
LRNSASGIQHPFSRITFHASRFRSQIANRKSLNPQPSTLNRCVSPAPVIDLHSDHYFMGEALRQAQRASAAGEIPVGAVVVQAGRIIARACNQVELLKDATAHAEMLALTQAQAAVGDWRLTDCTLYVTKEPCPMCAGATLMARLKRVVYALSDPKMGCLGGATDLNQLPQSNHHLLVTRGVLEQPCREVLQAYFQLKRQED